MNVSPLPIDSAERKNIPLLAGVVNYFPAALIGVAIISKLGNDQHNPGQPLHHARGKSMDHGECIMRHTVDVEAWKAHIARTGVEAQAVKILLTEARYRAWRALADLQQLEETYGGAPLAPAARLEPTDVRDFGAMPDSRKHTGVAPIDRPENKDWGCVDSACWCHVKPVDRAL